jgi:hypothetical protein
VTLILAHATSLHKELWEPFLEGLYAHAAVSSATRSSLVKIRDAWAIDCPNHGESAMLNEETLLCAYTQSVSLMQDLAGLLLKLSAETCTGESYSLIGGIRTSNTFHSKWVWKGHRDRLQVLQLGSAPGQAARLTRLFNACITAGYHPRSWREATVAVIPKPNRADYSLPKNYRPIALLECLGTYFPVQTVTSVDN